MVPKLLRKWYVLTTLVIVMWIVLIWFSYQIGWLPYHGKSLWATIAEPFVNIIDYMTESPIDFGNPIVNVTLALLFNLNLSFNFFVELIFLITTVQNNLRQSIGNADATIKRNKWGVVYNGLTKEPINQALVRLYTADGHKLLKTAITNVNGIFNFHVTPGRYIIEIKRNGYLYPSSLVAGQEDPPWTNVYHGGTLSIAQEGEIQLAVPLDPSEVSTFTRIWRRSYTRVSSMILTANFVWLIGGFLFSILDLVVYHDSLIGVLPFFAYITFFILRYYQSRLLPVNDGSVTDSHGAPVPNLPLGIFETDFGQLITRTFTDEQGRYRFLVTPANYTLRVLDQNYALLGKNGQPVTELSIPKITRGDTMVIHGDLSVQALHGTAAPSLIANASKQDQIAETQRQSETNPAVTLSVGQERFPGSVPTPQTPTLSTPGTAASTPEAPSSS